MIGISGGVLAILVFVTITRTRFVIKPWADSGTSTIAIYFKVLRRSWLGNKLLLFHTLLFLQAKWMRIASLLTMELVPKWAVRRALFLAGLIIAIGHIFRIGFALRATSSLMLTQPHVVSNGAFPFERLVVELTDHCLFHSKLSVSGRCLLVFFAQFHVLTYRLLILRNRVSLSASRIQSWLVVFEGVIH